MSAPSESSEMPWWRRYWPILVLACLPVLPLYRAVFLGEAIGPFDQIRHMAPWNGPKPANAWDVLQADGVLQFYVWRDLVFDSWRHGQIPFWNHYQLAGTPLLANSQSGALYPPHILFGLMHLPTAGAMTLLAWGHLFWAGLGVYGLCRALGGNKLGSFVGGAGFSLSTFMLAWTGLPSVIETVSWIPWVLMLELLILRGENLPWGQDKGIDRRRAIPALLAVVIGMMVLAGHLQFVAYGGIAAFLFYLWMAGIHWADSRSQGPDRSGGMIVLARSTVKLAIAAVLGLCIAAPQLLPVLNFSQYSHRRNVPTAEGYKAYKDLAIQPYELVKILIPTIQGNPRQVASDQLPVSTYYPAILHPGANFAESAVGLGVFVVLLVCLLPLLKTRLDPVWGILFVGLIGLLMALGTPVDELLYFDVPGWSSTGSPGRAICLFILAASVGAGVAASQLSRIADILKQRAGLVWASLGGFVFVCFVCFLFKDAYSLRQGLNPEIVNALKSQAESGALSSGVGVSLLALLAVGLAVREQRFRSRALLASVPVLGCLAFLGTSIVETGKPDLGVENVVGMARIAPINASWDLFQGVQAMLPPNLAALNRIHSLDGYDSLLHRDTVAMLRDVDGEDAAAEVNGNMMLIKPKADIKKLADAGVTEVWSRDPITELGDVEPQNNIYRYPIPGPGRASTPQGPATIVSESASSMKLQATGPGTLIVRERNMPGWLAKVDGKHVAIRGNLWIELELPEGQHTIELNYVAPGFATGMFASILGWLIVLSLGISGAHIVSTRRNAGVALGIAGENGSK